MSDAPTQEKKKGFFSRLKDGLTRSKTKISDGVTGIFTKRKLDGETLDDLEELLIQSDLGVALSARIAAQVGKGRYDKQVAPNEVRQILADEIAAVLQPVAKPFEVDPEKKPFVVLVVGVNGVGKTTTIGKLASQMRAEGQKLVLGAGDTFRAAAIDQLKIWGERVGAPVIANAVGSDAAGVAFETMDRAKADGADVVMIDTAGRLQNKTDLMAELEKVIRVIRKKDETAPHSVLLVLDATTGQNALNQVEVFQKVADVTGLVMTKLDGTARGGILVSVAERFGLPVHAIGVGEGIDDLQNFDAMEFANALTGVEEV
jgi:fused signal recognition particle receptor